MRSKNKTKTSFPQPHCFFPDSTSLPDLLPPPPSITRDGEWGLWLVPSHVSTASSSSRFCSSMGSHPQDTILHNPLQCGLLPKAEVLQECSVLVWVLPENLILKAPASFRASMGCSKACRMDIYSTMVLHGLQGENLLHKSPPQAAGSAPAPGAPPCFPPSISVELFLPPVPHTLFQAHWEVPPVWMTDSAWAVQGQPQSCLKWALSNVGQLPGSSPRSHPCSSLLQTLAT